MRVKRAAFRAGATGPVWRAAFGDPVRAGCRSLGFIPAP